MPTPPPLTAPECKNGVGLCAPHPHQGVPPWTQYTIGLGLKKSTGFCVARADTMRGAAPHPAKGVALGSPYTMKRGFKKSTGFCVEQQERMYCSVPRQRLSVCSGPGQPVDRGVFGMIRSSGKARFPGDDHPKTAPCRGEHGRSPNVSRGNTSDGPPTNIANRGCRGIIPLPAGGTRYSCLRTKSPQRLSLPAAKVRPIKSSKKSCKFMMSSNSCKNCFLE